MFCVKPHQYHEHAVLMLSVNMLVGVGKSPWWSL